ncbi:WD40 repeat domain-containing serine/threonine protein kinase [Roseibacillus persicicus]|uniref:WD40 repeat domain-containing serine/threonine protein kinase n=1 Tax=Roseibacillus persicicus TaxID=454148 RepID=UPI00280E966B|nr:serine/threonine-protein kinase [Roseibacillus persicicus]MDQ8188896.1 serine/threonine-protein kinase [Roseibacillus persicicus]
MSTICERCGTSLSPKGHCPKCLLETAMPESSQSRAERLFQASLALPTEERIQFIENSVGDDREALTDALLLLQGYEEEGGDQGIPTLGSAINARLEMGATEREEVGTIFNDFRLVRRIGEGGMGTVWEAEQSGAVSRQVALKVIKLGMDTREVVKRFERERQALALMNHPSIAQVFEAGATAMGRPYFVMELVEGRAIDIYHREKRLSNRELIELFIEVCGAIEHAHQKGIIHRDLKPSNILINEEGIPKIIDFGIARATSESNSSNYTLQAQVLGTPAYMSPEQAATDGEDIDTRTDVYSLGVVLYELLTGTPPFDPERLAKTGVLEMQKIIREEQPPRPSTQIARAELKSDATTPSPKQPFGSDLDWVVMKAISKERERRYASTAALAEDLRRYLAHEPVTAAPPTLSYQFGKFFQRNKAASIAAALILLSLILGLTFSLQQTHRAQVALAGEEKARRLAVLTIADLYTQSGAEAAAKGQDEVATLWFAKAALTARTDPARLDANRTRVAAWRKQFSQPVAVFDSGEDYVSGLIWNATQDALIVFIENVYYPQIWDMKESPKRWTIPVPDVDHASWSPDGKRLALTNLHNTFVVDYPSGDIIATLNTLSPAAAPPAWSADGETLFIPGTEHLESWKPETQERHATSIPAPSRFLHLSQTADTLLLVMKHTLEVREATSPFALRHPPQPVHEESQAQLLGEGHQYAFVDPDGHTVICDTISGDILETYSGAVGPQLNGTKLWSSPSGRYLARDNHALIDRTRPEFPGPILNGFEINFSPDESQLAAQVGGKQIVSYELPSGEVIETVGDSHLPQLAVRYSPDSRLLAFSEHGLVRVWKLPERDLVQQIDTGDPRGGFAALSPSEDRLLPLGHVREDASRKTTRVYRTSDGQPAGPTFGSGGIIMNGLFLYDGDLVALAVSTTPDRTTGKMRVDPGSGFIQIWNSRTGQLVSEPIEVPSEPRGLARHPSKDLLAVACAGGERLEIDLDTYQASTLYTAPHGFSDNGAISNSGRCRYSPDGRHLITWGFWSHEVWDRDRQEFLLPPRPQESTVFDLSITDHILAAGVVVKNDRVEFLDLATGKPARANFPYNGWCMVCRFSPSGERLLLAGGDLRSRVLDWKNDVRLGPDIRTPQSPLTGTFLPDEKGIVLGGYDPVITFSDVRSGRPLRPPVPHYGGWVLDLQVINEGKDLLITTQYANPALLSLEKAFPVSPYSLEQDLLLAEIHANATISESGGLERLTRQQWLEKWQQYQKGSF